VWTSQRFTQVEGQARPAARTPTAKPDFVHSPTHICGHRCAGWFWNSPAASVGCPPRRQFEALHRHRTMTRLAVRPRSRWQGVHVAVAPLRNHDIEPLPTCSTREPAPLRFGSHKLHSDGVTQFPGGCPLVARVQRTRYSSSWRSCSTGCPRSDARQQSVTKRSHIPSVPLG